MVASRVSKVGSGQTTKRQPNKASWLKNDSKEKSRVEGIFADLADICYADLALLMNGFARNPDLVTWLASLMRDGVLEKTLRDKLFGDQEITEPWRQLFLVHQLGLSNGAFLPFAHQKQ
jgi:hypothetical protein